MTIDIEKMQNCLSPKLGNLNNSQIEGFKVIIDEWFLQGYTDLDRLAYVLATVWHETAFTMQPIEEYGKGKSKAYGKKLKYGGGPNKRVSYITPDEIYYGRGYTQNTWFEIYEQLTKAKKARTEKWDFLNNPELLLQPKPSAWATVYAMNIGLYTGRKLSNYFNGTVSDALGARAILNGKDKAATIANYYKIIVECLKAIKSV